MRDNKDRIYIEFDEEKLKKYDISLDNAIEYLDEIFAKFNMERNKEGWYCGGSFETIGAANIILKKAKWFIKCASKWLWFQADDGCTEDALSYYRDGEQRYVFTK